MYVVYIVNINLSICRKREAKESKGIYEVISD